jgi:hypothetical protein
MQFLHPTAKTGETDAVPDYYYMRKGAFVRADTEYSVFAVLELQTLLQNETDWRWDYAMLFGYARVSTQEQDTAAQVAALKAAKCEQIFRKRASGGRWDRPELHRLLERLRPGDVLVVWKLDRLSRSLRDVLPATREFGVSSKRHLNDPTHVRSYAAPKWWRCSRRVDSTR